MGGNQQTLAKNNGVKLKMLITHLKTEKLKYSFLLKMLWFLRMDRLLLVGVFPLLLTVTMVTPPKNLKTLKQPLEKLKMGSWNGKLFNFYEHMI